MRFLVPIAFILLGACQGNPITAIDGFNVSCDVPEDCMAVLVGDVCGCVCEYAAINAAEAQAWADYDADQRAACTAILDCSVCPDAIVTCEAAECRAEMVEY